MKRLEPFIDGISFRTARMSVGLVSIVLVTEVACGRVNEPAPRWRVVHRASSWLPPAGTYLLDPDHLLIHFAAQHMVVGTVRGRFNTMKGAAVVESDPSLSTVDVVMQSASLDTQNGPRDAELRGPDFFDAEAFPAIEYDGAGFRRVGDRWTVDGSLTIRRVTLKVPLELGFNGMAAPRANDPRANRDPRHCTGETEGLQNHPRAAR